MAGFWTAKTMRERIPAEALIRPYREDRVTNGAYELSLGPEVYVTSEQRDTKRLLDNGEQIVIPPGQFANLLTQERVRVPADSLGLISVKFRLKQRGLVNVSGFHVDPGYDGKLLFSVYNAGPSPVVIAQGDPAFLLWYAGFDGVIGEEDLYKGELRNTITSTDVMRLQGKISTPQALAARMDQLEQRLDRWSSIIGTVLKAAAGVVVGLVITGLIAAAAGVISSDDPGSTTTTSESTTTSSARVPTTTGP